MIPLRTGGPQPAGLLPSNLMFGQESATSSALGQASQHSKKSTSKQRAGAATSQGFPSGNNTSGNTVGGLSLPQSSANRGETINIHNQTTKIPQHYLGSNYQQQHLGPTNIEPLSASQKKRISLKKLEEEYNKTIEQVGSPNSNTINLENMKKTNSLHYVRAGSGASSPQQVKSRTSIGKYAQNPGSGMAIYQNYNNQIIIGQQQPLRNSYVSKSQIGGPSMIGGQTTANSMPGSVLGSGAGQAGGNRSRSKTTNRKKRNLYTSVGNYYQQSQTNGSSHPQAPQTNNNSASRVTKRVHQQNFLENLEQTGLFKASNLAVHHNMLVQEDLLTKKRNKSSTKSYNNKELLDHNNSSEICYSSHIAKKNPMTNNFFDVSQFSSNQNSIAKNFDNSFHFTAGGFLPNQGKQQNPSQGNNTINLNGVLSANKQRPTSSNKTNMIAAVNTTSNNSSQKQVKKKSVAGALRKSVNAAPSTHYNTGNIMNSSANYGHHLQQNAYDFLSNASLFINSSKAARRPKGASSAVDSRCSQNKDSHANALGGLLKSQVTSNTAFGNQPQLTNTSHTTICSNRKQGEIVSGKKHSLQQQQQYMSLAAAGGAGLQHNPDILTADQVSSDRQTLKMNDFLKQIEAYSNDKLDKFMPSLSQVQSINTGNFNQAKIAEQVKNTIDREMIMMNVQRTASSKQRYANDESRESQQYKQEEEDDEEEAQNNPDYEHLLNVISDSFNQLIATFYQGGHGQGVVGMSLARIKESYEEIINSIVENLSQQIEGLSLEVEQANGETDLLRVRNDKLEKHYESSDKNQQQILSFTKQNEVLVEELNRLYEENKALKRDQKDRDTQIIESKKLIEKLSVSQKQLQTVSSSNKHHHNSQGSSKTAGVKHGESQLLNQQSKKSKISIMGVPPLDLGKLKIAQNPMPLLSNDSLQTLDKALLNANLQEASQSSIMNTIPQNDAAGRMLDELYQPFNANNQSDISYQDNSDEGEGTFNGNQQYQGPHPLVNQSGRQSSIAQDKSPIQKPFIPPLNLNGLNNRTQAAKQQQPPPPQPKPIQQTQQQWPPQQQKFKLDLNQVHQQKQPGHAEQDDYNRPPAKIGGLGLNLAGLKQQMGIVDFQDEFMARQDEYSQSWRDAIKREKRF